MEKINCNLKKQPFKRGYTYIHVNQTSIKQANKYRKQAIDGEITKEEALLSMPHALTAKTKDSNTYGSTIKVIHPNTGELLLEIEHTPFNPYSCGAQIVIKTTMDVLVSTDRQ